MDLVVFSLGTQVLVDLVGPDGPGGPGGLFPRHSSSGGPDGPGGPGGLFPRNSSFCCLFPSLMNIFLICGPNFMKIWLKERLSREHSKSIFIRQCH